MIGSRVSIGVGGRGRYGGWGRSVFNNDYFTDTALVVNFLYFAVADGILVGPLALAGYDLGSGHDCGI